MLVNSDRFYTRKGSCPERRESPAHLFNFDQFEWALSLNTVK